MISVIVVFCGSSPLKSISIKLSFDSAEIFNKYLLDKSIGVFIVICPSIIPSSPSVVSGGNPELSPFLTRTYRYISLSLGRFTGVITVEIGSITSTVSSKNVSFFLI
jgi:hypothetical protein